MFKHLHGPLSVHTFIHHRRKRDMPRLVNCCRMAGRYP